MNRQFTPMQLILIEKLITQHLRQFRLTSKTPGSKGDQYRKLLNRTRRLTTIDYINSTGIKTVNTSD